MFHLFTCHNTGGCVFHLFTCHRNAGGCVCFTCLPVIIQVVVCGLPVVVIQMVVCVSPVYLS